MEVKIISQFENEEDFGGDPYGYYVEIEGQRVMGFGDDYHDDGGSKCEAFIKGWMYAKGVSSGEVEINYEDRADWE